MRRYAFIVAALFTMAPFGAQAADLVVSWHKGFHAEEDAALAEVVAAFEQDSGKQVEITLVPLAEQPPKIEAALEAGRPPDVAFGLWLLTYVRSGGSRTAWWI
jgi:multiple sugar transport system substrate-binding protein